MNNEPSRKAEPVAWMTENGTIFDELPSISGGLIPLYTHPAKTLTDEEILDTFNPKFMCDLEDSDVVDFARAILRKAQEK